MAVDWSAFVELVQRHQRFLLTTHVRPDGDALGSCLALLDALDWLGKQGQAVVASNIPPRYDFLNCQRRVSTLDPANPSLREAEAVIVLDTGTWGQLGEFGPLLRSLEVPKVVIDHHATQDDLGALQCVDTSAEATGRLVYQARQALGVPLSPPAAHALFVALAMDTGWFRHSNVRPDTFVMAADLTQAGANPSAIYAALFENNSLPRLHLMGRVLQRIELLAGGRLAYSSVYQSDYAETKARPAETEDMIGHPQSIGGVELTVLFMEQADPSVKVSFRSRRADVAVLAEKFGGGGHALASGATVSGTMDEVKEQVLAAALQTLAELG
jgi:phosphoesterase RecJ-like protein